MTVKDLQGFLEKITYYEENLKFVQVSYNSNTTQRMLWIVYRDVPSLNKLLKKKKAVVAAGRPKSVERSFSSLKRIKSFSQNKMEQDRLSDLGLISSESQLLTEVMETKSFQDSVITEFASVEKRMEFTFK